MTPTNCYKTFNHPSAFSSGLPLATPEKPKDMSNNFLRKGTHIPVQVTNFTNLPFNSTYDKSKRY
jgi:hypothetical protein